MERKEPYLKNDTIEEIDSEKSLDKAFREHENRTIKRKSKAIDEYWKTVIIGKILLVLFFAVVVTFLFKGTPSKITIPKNAIESSKTSQTKKASETKCISWNVNEC